jgi:hypothetical protein
METCGFSSVQGEAELGNGQIASQCYVVPLEQEFDGYGTPRITYGQRCIRNRIDDGFMSTLVRTLGTNHACILKVSFTLSIYHQYYCAYHDRSCCFSTGWGKKIAYCIAFSIDGATDVTRRYVRNFQRDGAGRNRAPEEALLHIIHEIRKLRREGLSKEAQRRLSLEDTREESELASYVAQYLVNELVTGRSGAIDLSESRKHPLGRATGVLRPEAAA